MGRWGLTSATLLDPQTCIHGPGVRDTHSIMFGPVYLLGCVDNQVLSPYQTLAIGCLGC